MEALVVVGGLAALAYFMNKPKARPTAADFMADQQNSVAFYKRKEAEMAQRTESGMKQLQPTDNHKEAPPSANLMLNQHVDAAKQLVASGGDLTDLIGMRKDAARAVMENTGQVKQTPLPPPNVGYVNAMKRQNLSSGKIIFNKL